MTTHANFTQKWEHKTVTIIAPVGSGTGMILGKDFDMTTNSLGQEGWELVAPVPQANGSWLLFFKRPIVESTGYRSSGKMQPTDAWLPR